MKKILSVILVLALALTVLPAAAFAAEPHVEVTPDYAWYGDGEAVEYTLTDVEDLFGFANIVNGKAIINEATVKDSFNGKTVRLNSNIDLTGIVWTPIGSSMYDHAANEDTTKKFEGTFDGGNHTVTGLSSAGYVPLDEDVGPSKEYSFGLFGYIYGANITNVKLANVSINCCDVILADERKAAGSGVSALVGFYVPKDGAVSVIENCHVLSGEVIASNNMGGLIGYLQVMGNNEVIDVTVKGCTNAADVTTMAREAGGILGLAQQSNYSNTGTLKFVNCSNSGNIYAENGGGCSVAGGILGQENTSKSYGTLHIIFDTCSNSGTITANGEGVGEVHASGIGTAYYNTGPWLVAKDCNNTGNIVITGDSPANFGGGILAYGPYATIENCTNTGKIIVQETDKGNVLIGNVYYRLYLNGTEGDFVSTGSYSEFMLNGGVMTNPRTWEKVDDDVVFSTPDPTRTNYIFGGWYDNQLFTGEAIQSFTNGHTYHAKWIPVAPTVMISGATETEITLTATHPVDGVTYTWYKNGELISSEGSTLTVESRAESVTYTAKAAKDGVESNFSNSIIIYDEVKAAMEAATEALVVGAYSGAYDGAKHNITVTCGENAIAYYMDAGCSEVTDGFTDAGTYPVYYKISVPVGNETYYLGGDSTVTIAKATVTVTADNKTADVGDDQPALTYTAVGFVGEDTFIAEPTCTAVDVDMERAGSYAITVSGGTVSGNYEIEYVNGTLTVINLLAAQAPAYTASVPANVSISPANPWPGMTVTVTMTDENMDGVRVVDSKGNPVRVTVKDGKFSFVMPNGNIEVVPFELQFTDISESDYYADALLWAIANDITQGTGETTFSPSVSCTRAQMVTFLWRAAGCPAPAAAESEFTDVDPDAYYAKALLWALENGITAGTGDSVFSPNAACDRAQMAVFLCRMMDGKADSTEETFSDVAADAYYAEAVQWAVEQGITYGTGDGAYSPDAVCTRAQMVTFLWRCFVN